MPRYRNHKPFPNAYEDSNASKLFVRSPQTESSAYRLAYLDDDFLIRDELRPVRLQLELLKPELIQDAAGIDSTVVVFGSARTLDSERANQRLEKARQAQQKNPGDDTLEQELTAAQRAVENAFYYEEARRFTMLLSEECRHNDDCKLIVVTGGGPGIMEAANRGSADAGADSIGLNIVLPMEQDPNPYITPDLCFQFHYFAIRKMHFLMRAKALVAFPGGFGTLDELFEALTLIQTKKIKPVPVLLFGRNFWNRIIDFEGLVFEGMISREDLKLFIYVESAEEACRFIYDYYRNNIDDGGQISLR